MVDQFFFDVSVQREIGQTIGRPTAYVETFTRRQEPGIFLIERRESRGGHCTCNMREPVSGMSPP